MKNKSIFSLLFLLLLGSHFSCQQKSGESQKPSDPTSKQAQQMLEKACQFLASQQGEDGGWHSEVHGILRGGEAYTPFISQAVWGAVPHFKEAEKMLEQSIPYIRNHVNENGVLGASDPVVLEYPNYSTALGMRMLAENGDEQDKALIRKMTRYLVQQQFDNSRGIPPDHLAYGSWGFGEKLESGGTGHIDLSHTRRVLQALRASGYDNKSTYMKAHYFLRVLQKHPSEGRPQPWLLESDTGKVNYDGGFYFSPIVRDANKGKEAPADENYQSQVRSYATATCDGILALIASGESVDSDKVQEALQWLERHPKFAYPQGIPEDDPDQWHTVMIFYHLMVRSEVYHAIDYKGSWKKEMIDLLAKEQKENGSFFNPLGDRNKEDDPLLATAMVLMVLNNVLAS